MNTRHENRRRTPLPDQHVSICKLFVGPLVDRGGFISFLRYIRSLGIKETFLGTGRMLRRAMGATVDKLYDRRHNMDTSGCIAATDIDVEGESKKYSHGYAPTPEKSFRAMLDSVPLDLRDFSFVDYGCGKGRTLVMAAQKTFRRIVGVEHSGELARIATGNIATYRKAHDNCPSMEVFHSEALDFDPPPGPCFFYLYSPFRGRVLRGVVDKIRQSYEQSPRAMIFLYSEDRDTLEIPVELFETVGGTRLLRESTVSCDFGAPRPIIYAVFANKEALQLVRRA